MPWFCLLNDFFSGCQATGPNKLTEQARVIEAEVARVVADILQLHAHNDADRHCQSDLGGGQGGGADD